MMGNRYTAACSVPTCSEKHHAKGFCMKHYTRFRKEDFKSADSQAELIQYLGRRVYELSNELRQLKLDRSNNGLD